MLLSDPRPGPLRVVFKEVLDVDSTVAQGSAGLLPVLAAL